MAEPFLGEIRMFGFPFAPMGWAMCNGQSMNIVQNTALYAVIYTSFGGDGKTTFNLPNLQGTLAMGPGQGPGLTNRTLGGNPVGTNSVTLNASQMPQHTHALTAQNAAGAQNSPAAAVLAQGVTPSGRETQPFNTYINGQKDVALNSGVVASAGKGGAHENRQPVQALNFCIAINGLFPVYD